MTWKRRSDANAAVAEHAASAAESALVSRKGRRLAVARHESGNGNIVLTRDVSHVFCELGNVCQMPLLVSRPGSCESLPRAWQRVL